MPDYSLFGDEHVREYEATGGKVGHDWNGASCLILHTRGRKSGAIRKIPLIYGRDGGDYEFVKKSEHANCPRAASFEALRQRHHSVG